MPPKMLTQRLLIRSTPPKMLTRRLLIPSTPPKMLTRRLLIPSMLPPKTPLGTIKRTMLPWSQCRMIVLFTLHKIIKCWKTFSLISGEGFHQGPSIIMRMPSNYPLLFVASTSLPVARRKPWTRHLHLRGRRPSLRDVLVHSVLTLL
jgi:hypothetical protein